MTDFDVVQAKKFFYSKDIKSAYEMFIKSEDYLYEAGLCALLLKDEKTAKKLWKKSQNISPASGFGLCVLDYIHLKTTKIPTFFQTRAQLEIYINLFIEHGLIEWAQNLVSCNECFVEANPESYKFISRVLFANGYFKLAIHFCKKSLDMFFCDPEALLILSQCQFLLGDLANSIESVNKILRFVPEYYPAQVFRNILIEESNKKRK